MKVFTLGENMKRRQTEWPATLWKQCWNQQCEQRAHGALVPFLKVTRQNEFERWSGWTRGWAWDLGGVGRAVKGGGVKWKSGSPRPGWGELQATPLCVLRTVAANRAGFNRRTWRTVFRIINLVNYSNAFKFYSWTHTPQMSLKVLAIVIIIHEKFIAPSITVNSLPL